MIFFLLLALAATPVPTPSVQCVAHQQQMAHLQKLKAPEKHLEMLRKQMILDNCPASMWSK